MKILEKCLIMEWDGILIPARKRDSLEVCTGRGTLARVVIKQEGEEMVAFLKCFFSFFNGCFSFASNILNRYRYIYFRPGNKGFYVDIFLCVVLWSLHLNFFVKSLKQINSSLFFECFTEIFAR